jgi:hypothetical protein
MGLGTFPKPQTFIGFSTTIPADPPPIVTEPSGNYRYPFSHWVISNSREVYNDRIITIYSRSDWGTIRYFLIWDAQTGGNLLGYGILPAPVSVLNNRVISFAKGQLLLRVNPDTITNYLSNIFLGHVFGTITLTSVHSYVGLSYVNPTDSGVPSPPVYEDYHDVLFSGWGVTDISELVNADLINFNPVSNWGSIPYVYIRDSDNNVLLYSAFVTPVEFSAYNPVTIYSNGINIIFD